MKKNKQELFDFLVAEGAWGRGKSTLLKAKAKYRRLQKNKWAREYRKSRHEIRFLLTTDDFRRLKSVTALNESPTALTKKLVLRHLEGKSGLVNQDRVQEAYRRIGLLINQARDHNLNQKVVLKLLEIESVLEEQLNQ